MKTLPGTERTFENMLNSLKWNFTVCPNSWELGKKKTHGQHPSLGCSWATCSALTPTMSSSSAPDLVAVPACSRGTGDGTSSVLLLAGKISF